jgi:hypothetical protein
VILVVLLILAILTERASVALTSSLRDVTDSRNYQTERVLFAQTDAGLEEARGRLMGSPATNPSFIGDPSPTPNPLWSAYLLTSSTWKFSQDPTYDKAYTNYVPVPGSLTNTAIKVNSLQTGLPYWIKIRHKREYEAEREGHRVGSPHYVDGDGDTKLHSAANPGNIIYYGFYPPGASSLVQFTAPGTPAALPVELVQVYSSSGNTWIEVDAVHQTTPNPPLAAPVYTKGPMVFAWNPGGGKKSSPTGKVDGNDSCGQASGLPPVYTQTPWITFGTPQFDGNPDTPQKGPLDLDLKDYIDRYNGGATKVDKDQKDTIFGSPTNYVTLYSDTSKPQNFGGLKLEDVTGYGTLLVDGDLVLEDKISWNGLIIVNGLLWFDGKPGQQNIRGGILANMGIATDKNPDLRYDSCEVAKALGTQPLKLTRWRYRS